MKQFNMVDYNLKKSTDLKILNVNYNYISMLIVTNKSYVYAEKYYKDAQLQSCLTFEIFKKQKFKSLNFNQIRMLVTNQFYDDSFDELYLTKYLRKNRIDYHRWYEKDDIINTSIQRKK